MLENARIAWERTRIVAPVDGYVTRKTAQIGQQVAPGQSLMVVIPSNDLWVVANYKETQLQQVRPGQEAEIEIDTFPGHKFRGTVDSLSPNTGAAVALLPPDNATGNFTKVVQRVPVKVRFARGQQGLDLLRGGLSAVVNIRTRGGR
jgi:membrane fusion protein (multidrug efflux system)